VLEASVQWNYTTMLNILFLALSALLVWRFLGTGGPKMLAHDDGAGGWAAARAGITWASSWFLA
jgi:hypothetical protein